MCTEQWIIGTNIAVAFGTILLAIVALVSIWQVKNRQVTDNKNRAKDDIKEWAQDIADFTIAPDVKFAIIQDSTERGTMEYIHWLDSLNSKIRAGKRMTSLAQFFNDASILQSIKYLIEDIESVYSLLQEHDSPPLVYKPVEFLKVQEMNGKAIELIAQLDKSRA